MVNSFRFNLVEPSDKDYLGDYRVNQDIKHKQDTVKKGLPQLKEQADKARAVIRKYVPADAIHGTPLKNITLNPDPRRWGRQEE